MPIPVDKDSLKEYFKQTSPKYKDGKYFTGPESAYRPFHNIWERYGKTNSKVSPREIRKYTLLFFNQSTMI